MIYYRYTTAVNNLGDVWVPILANQVDEPGWLKWKDGLQLKIGHMVWTKESAEFREALEKERMWERLEGINEW